MIFWCEGTVLCGSWGDSPQGLRNVRGGTDPELRFYINLLKIKETELQNYEM